MAEMDGKIEEVFADILLIKNVLKENIELKNVIDSPHIPVYKKDKVFNTIFTGKITNISEHFLLLIIKKRRVPELYSILDEFVTIYNKHHNIKIAKITVSQEIDSDLISKVVSILETELHTKIEVQMVINPNIIGGMIIKVDDMLIDASISSKIARLKTEFSQNKYKVSY
jgi:F-type H+-transporting ATPase subunit delta